MEAVGEGRERAKVEGRRRWFRPDRLLVVVVATSVPNHVHPTARAVGALFDRPMESRGDGTSESTPLLRSPPVTPPPRQPLPSTSSSSQKSLVWIIAFLFLLNIATLGAGYYCYQRLHLQLLSQDHRIESLVTEYQLKLSRYETAQNISLSKIKEMESNLDTRLSILEEVPSNENVLEELRSTEQAMFNEIEAEKTLVGVMVRGIQANVSTSINRSNRLVDKKLEEVDKRIKSSERRMSALVEETSRNVTASVQLAEDHIEVIDTNLTSQMTSMTVSVSNALYAVRNMVEAAKVDINEEVSAVHQSMDQYIIFSNNQFAAENDFVKYQLAGLPTPPHPTPPLSSATLS
jgi:hypothetical protein